MQTLSVSGTQRQTDRLRWRKCCAILESLSPIAIHEEGPSIDISTHSLIHAWAEGRQDYQSRSTAWQLAATILALSYEGWHGFVPSSSTSNLTFEPVWATKSGILQIPYLTWQSLRYYCNLRVPFTVPELMLRLVLSFNITAPDYKMVASSIRKKREEINVFTARVNLEKGDYREAIHMFRDVRESRARRLAEDDPDRLDAEHGLAIAYERNGQTDKVVDLLEHVAKAREKLAEDHPNRLDSQHALANAYEANGQIKEAVELLKHVIKVRAKLTEDHPNRLTSQHALTTAYEANEQIKETIELLEYVVRIRVEKLSEYHLYRLNSQNNLAFAYKANE